MNGRHLLGGVALAALLASATAVHAQQTTGAITGVVLNGGAPVANATVTILHKPSGTRSIVQTDAAGVFDTRGLRVGGPYSVTASAPSGKTEAQDAIFLTVGDVLRLELQMGDQLSEVVVKASPRNQALIANVGSRTTLRAADIEAVVSVKRDLRDIGRRDPLASLDFVNRGTGPSGGLYIAGSSPRRNRITIDGVRSQDDYGLNTGGLSTNRGPVSLEAVEQVTIQATPFDVEDGDFTGGALNLILKSGGNDLHGSLFAFKRERRFAGDELPRVGFTNNDVTQPMLNGFQRVTNKIHEQNYGAFISGPIIRDKLFFAFGYENFSSVDTTSFGPSDGGFANAFNPIPGVSTGPKASTADINSVLANYNGYAASSLLPPGSVRATAPIKDEKESFKLDWNVTDNQRLTAAYRHAFSSVVKRSPSATTISLDTNWYSQPENEDNYSLQLNSKWGSRFSTEARVAYRSYQRGQLPPEGQGFANLSICTDVTSLSTVNACSSGVPTIQIGPDQFRQANVLKTSDLSAEFIGTYRLNDSNSLKFGYQYKGIDIFNLFVQQAHGIYYFDSVNDFRNGVANQLSYNTAVSGNLLDAAAVLNYQVHTLLAQDTWDVAPGLTVNAGLRYDIYAAGDAPPLNQNFVNRYGFNNQETYGGRSVLMPRLSAKWRTDKFELSGGVGLVSGGIPDVFIANSYGAQTGVLTNGFVVRRNADGSFTETAANLPISAAQGNALLTLNKADPSFITTQSALATSLVTADSAAKRLAFTNSIAPGFDIPADWKVNLSFRTTQLGLDWGFDAVATYTDTSVAFRDLRARLLTVNGVQQLTPDGRLRYDGLNITAANRALLGLPSSTNPDLVNVGLNGDIQAYNPSQKSWNQTIALSVGKAWRGLDANVSYTFQRGRQAGQISEFGTTEGGNSTTGNYYADQSYDTDPNGIASGKPTNLIREAAKLNVSYKIELRPGWVSRFTLFGDLHQGRPFSFLMTDPAGARNPTFGTTRDDALAYVPQLDTPDAANPLKYTTGSTVVYFDSAASVAKFKALVTQFHLPQATIVPKGFGRNPYVNRFDFQFSQTIPTPIRGHELLATLDIANLGNLINRKWGVVKEYTTARSGGVLVNAQCADAATGLASGAGSPVCSAYRYSYTTASPTVLATPTIDQISSLFTIEFGLKYKF
ncbi:TonB-dependent receptor [soil metagenome]